MRPILIAYDQPDEFRDFLATRFPGMEFVGATTARDVLEALARHDPEIVFSIKHPGLPGPAHAPIPAHPSVRWIQLGNSGYEHLEPWDAGRVTVTHGAGVLAPYLAESVTGAMIVLSRGFLGYLEQQRQRLWKPAWFTPLEGRTLLVVGLGAVGACVARNAKALGMKVLGIRATPAPHPDVDEVHGPEALTALLPLADFVSLHVRLNATTRGLLSREAIAAMKPGAYLDIFETEPLPPGSPLWAMPNVLVTPHASDSIVGWTRRFATLFADNLDRWQAGEPLVNRVAP